MAKMVVSANRLIVRDAVGLCLVGDQTGVDSGAVVGETEGVVVSRRVVGTGVVALDLVGASCLEVEGVDLDPIGAVAHVEDLCPEVGQGAAVVQETGEIGDLGLDSGEGVLRGEDLVSGEGADQGVAHVEGSLPAVDQDSVAAIEEVHEVAPVEGEGDVVVAARIGRETKEFLIKVRSGG